jgi:outer membrane protein assembly factor BamA
LKRRSRLQVEALVHCLTAISAGLARCVFALFDAPGRTDGRARNQSSAFALGGELYFRRNTYRATTAFARGNLNYDLYGLGAGANRARLPLEQTGQAFFGEFLRRLPWKLFLGPRFLWGSSVIALRSVSDDAVPLPPDIGLRTTLTALGFGMQRDTRSNRFYPTGGSLLDVTSDFFSGALGSKYAFQSYKVTFNKYAGLTKNQILAYNVFGCATGGRPPFYGNCIYGTDNELRGYVAGRYLDRYMVATQLEYRLGFPWRLGLVGFGGVGGSRARRQPAVSDQELPAEYWRRNSVRIKREIRCEPSRRSRPRQRQRYMEHWRRRGVLASSLNAPFELCQF